MTGFDAIAAEVDGYVPDIIDAVAQNRDAAGWCRAVEQSDGDIVDVAKDISLASAGAADRHCAGRGQHRDALADALIAAGGAIGKGAEQIALDERAGAGDEHPGGDSSEQIAVRRGAAADLRLTIDVDSIAVSDCDSASRRAEKAAMDA